MIIGDYIVLREIHFEVNKTVLVRLWLRNRLHNFWLLNRVNRSGWFRLLLRSFLSFCIRHILVISEPIIATPVSTISKLLIGFLAGKNIHKDGANTAKP